MPNGAGTLLLTAVEGSVEVLVMAGLLVLLVRGRDALLAHWRRGLVVALLVLLMAVPQHLATMVFVDSRQLMGAVELPTNADIERLLHGATLGSIAVGAVATTLLRMGWYGLISCVAVATWASLRPGEPLLGSGLRTRMGPLLACLGLGVLAGALSAWLFHALRVDAGQALQRLASFYPRLAEAEVTTRALVALPWSMSAALTEEIVFRGALLGALLGWAGQRRGPVIAAVLCSSLLWALLHLSLTDAPVLKLAQIFLLGLALAAVTRRWGLDAAILAHLGLNAAGLVGLVLLGG